MKCVICTVAYGGWYHRGVARMIDAFARVSPGYELQSWVNVLPPETPRVVKDGVDYTGYAAKPWALAHAIETADVALLIDASVYPVKHIEPLLDFVNAHGYYLAPAGFTVGEWTNDAMLAENGLDRDHALEIPDVASGVVGLANTRTNRQVVESWCAMTLRESFGDPHSNAFAADKRHHYRNVGFVSYDPRCSGHRHDQSALSILAYQSGLTDLTPWPRFVAYGGSAKEETVLEIKGM